MSARSWASRLLMLGALGGIASTQTGCLATLIVVSLLDDDDDEPPLVDDDWDDEQEWEDPSPPSIEITIADWPPLGASSVVTVHASAPNGISAAEFLFRNTVSMGGTGQPEAVFAPTGVDLGEGFGTLTVTVTGSDGAGTSAFVDNLLVDLTPPEAVLGPTTLPATGASFDFYMGDAWVVSAATLEFGGVKVEEVLPEGYPDTLGVDWDYSLVRVDVAHLPAITDTARLTITDAAGNEITEEFTLTIDGAPPAADIRAPAQGATVSGIFEVEVELFDSQPGPVVVELSAGGTVLATGIGPDAILLVDAEELPAGPIELEAVAIDEAGNTSAPVGLDVFVEHEVEEELPPRR
jgi:hypothetical protein